MKYKFEDIIFNITEKKKPVEEDKYNYIGLEHLESGNLFISKWGSDTAPEGEKIVMKKGDVLFGKRRAYQKKVAISPIDGIFSAHGMVLRPKEDVICKEFLPFFISSETFLNEAIRISVGGLSPTVNWKDIREQEFDLPSLAEQKVLAEKLWAAYEVKQSYLKMIEATEKMVKSQFVEMFGDCESNAHNFQIKKVGDFAECFAGATPSTKVSAYWDNGNIPWMSSGEVHKGRVKDTDAKISQQGYDGCSTKMVPAHSVVIALAGQGKTRGTVAINDIELCTNQSLCAIVPNEEVNYEYLYHNLRGRYKELRSMSGDVDGRGGLNLKHIQSIKVVVPPMEEQLKFVSIAQQADKSISELRKSVDAIDKVIKSLINENL